MRRHSQLPPSSRVLFEPLEVRVLLSAAVKTPDVLPRAAALPPAPVVVTTHPLAATSATSTTAHSGRSARLSTLVTQAPDVEVPYNATALVGADSTFQVTATGAPAPTFSLTAFPAGMTIDSATGLIDWTPTVAQVGANLVKVKATNVAGSDTSSFTITVPSALPVFTTTALPDPVPGAPFSTQLTATAAVGPDVPAPTFSLVSGPAGLTVAADGTINWTPTAAQLGTQAFTAQATNIAGATAQSFSLTVAPDTTAPSVPVLTLGPITSTTAIPLQWTAATDNGVLAGYRLYQWFPAVYSGGGRYRHLVSPAKYVLLTDNITTTSYTVTGLTPDTGYNFAVAAFDAAGNQSAYSNIVNGRTLLAPSFTWSTTGSNVDPPLSVVANHPLSVLIFPSGDPFPTLDVTNLPAGATFTPGNYTNSQLTYQSPTLNWTPTAGQVGVNAFTVTVTNSVGTVTQQVPIVVTADVPVPSVSLNGGLTYTVGNMVATGPNAYTLNTTETFDFSGSSPQYALPSVPFNFQLGATSNTPGTTFSLVNAPAGMTIDPASGAGQWTPASEQTGATSFTVAETNSAGTTLLTVNFPTYGTTAPTGLTISFFTSIPATSTTSAPMSPTISWGSPAETGNVGGYKVTVTEVSTGLVTVVDSLGFTSATLPGLNQGQYFVSVASYDQYGNPGLSSAVSSFYMAALPRIGWNFSSPTASVGTPYSIQFTDFAAATVSYALSMGPSDSSIDPVTGLLQWTPTTSDVGDASIVVSATTQGWGTIYMMLEVPVA